MQNARSKVMQLEASLAHIEKLKVDYLERYNAAQKETHSISDNIAYRQFLEHLRGLRMRVESQTAMARVQLNEAKAALLVAQREQAKMEAMVERGWKFGGENSGHILCLDQHTTGDAIVAALQVLRALVESNLTLARACAPVALYPQVMINVPVKRRADFQAHAGVAVAVKKAQGDLADQGRVLLRPSGTEPVIRVMVEAKSRTKASRWAKAIAVAVKAAG